MNFVKKKGTGHNKYFFKKTHFYYDTMVNTKSMKYIFVAKDGDVIYGQQKQDSGADRVQILTSAKSLI